MRIFNLDSPVMQFLTKVSMMMWLGILWLVSCLGIVTIGAATAALYRMMLNLRQDLKCNTKAFFEAFGENFKQATGVFLVRLGVIAVAVGAYLACFFTDNDILLGALLTVAVVAFLGWLITGFYAYALVGYFENTLGETLKNSLKMAIRYRKATMLGVVIAMLPAMVYMVSSFVFALSFLAWIAIYPGLAAYLISSGVQNAFDEIAPREPLPQEE